MDTKEPIEAMDAEQPKDFPLSFTGSGGEFFRIWIVNILLTIVTLYIYSAWAKVRTKRYFHGNTVLDGSSFEYHAKPLQILLSRLVAAALFLAVTFGQSVFPLMSLVALVILFLIIPWAVWRSTKFNMRMTSYRNVRFGFDGSVWPLYLYMLVIPVLAYALIVALIGASVYMASEVGLHLPVIIILVLILATISILLAAFTQHRLYQYFFNHYLYGKSRFVGNFSHGVFRRIYVYAALLGLVTFVVIALLAAYFSIPEGMTREAFLEGLASLESEEPSAVSGIIVMLVLKLAAFLFLYVFLFGFLLTAFIAANVRNHVYGNVALDHRVSFKSDVSVTGLWWVMFSNLLLVSLSIGLAIPYTRVRMAKFMARHTVARSATSLDKFAGEKRAEIGAFGDELGDAFDMEMDVGF